LATDATQIARVGHAERLRYRRNTVHASVSCEFRSKKQCFCDRVAAAVLSVYTLKIIWSRKVCSKVKSWNWVVVEVSLMTQNL
jgi:hypothetical protein